MFATHNGEEEEEEEFADPEEGGFDDATSTGTKREEGDQSLAQQVPHHSLSRHLSDFKNANQTTRDIIRTLTDVLSQVNSSDQSCIDMVSMGFVSLILQKLDETGLASSNSREEIVRLCTLIILNLTAVPSCHYVICDQGGIRILCNLLDKGNDQTKGYAAVALGNLATNPTFSAQIGDFGAINLLIKYIQTSATNAGIEKAVGSVWNLVSNHRENKHRVALAEGIYPLVTLLQAEVSTIQEYAAGAVAKLSSESDLAAMLIDHDAVTPLVRILSTGSDMRKQHACLAIRNLAVKSKAKRMIAAAKGIEPLIKLLSTGTKRCQLDAVAALGNLSTTARNRALIGEFNGIQPLVNMLGDTQSKDTWPKICTALKHLSHNVRNIKHIGNTGAIPTLIKLLKSNDSNINLKTKEDVVECISNLAMDIYCDVSVGTMLWDTFFGVDRVKALANEGIVQLLIDYLKDKADTTDRILELSAIALCNLCSKNVMRSSIINIGGIRLFTDMISNSDNRSVRINCAGILGNIACQDQKSANEIVNDGAVVYMLKLLGDEMQIKKHRIIQEEKDIIAAALWNICSVNEDARQCLITDGEEIIARLVQNFPSSDRIYRLQKILRERPIVEY